MITLRHMELEDLPLFKTWVYLPHVAKWYLEPLDWIDEIEKQNGEFHWIHHFIAEYEGTPIGFCQYYACEDSDELWEGYTRLGGSYSIDYMIGETDFLRKGFGKEIILSLIEKVTSHQDAKRIVVQPDQDNKASCNVLLSCGFEFDLEKEIYVLNI